MRQWPFWTGHAGLHNFAFKAAKDAKTFETNFKDIFRIPFVGGLDGVAEKVVGVRGAALGACAHALFCHDTEALGG